MKRLCLLSIMAGLLLLAFPLTASADEPAKYNFASAQGDKELEIASGGSGTGFVYFYNIDGNRITHISLTVSRAPEGWDVVIEPPLAETRVEVSGMPVTVTENLYVEPTGLLTEEPRNVPEGMVSIKVPGRGYTLGKQAQVIITIPETAPPGSAGEITIAAEAAWLGQGGSAAIKQARDFNFKVTVVSGKTEYSEKVIGPDGEATGMTKETSSTQPYGAISPDGEESAGFFSGKWLPVVIAGAVVILVVIIAVLLVRRKE